MATTTRSAAARLTGLIVSAALLVGAQVLSVVPKAYAASPGTISGTVFDARNGQPLENVAISEVGSSEQPVLTNAAGEYTMPAAVGDHTLTANLTDYVPKNSAVIFVADSAQVQGVNFTLMQYASIQGTAEDADGNGIAGVLVKLYDATTNLVNPTYTVTSTANGTFEYGQVVPGSYKVQFDTRNVPYMTRWLYDVATRDQAQVIDFLSAGGTDLTTTLVRASSVAGSVKDAAGHPIAGAKVTLYRNGAPVGTTTASSATGAYYIGSIASAGQYTVLVTADGYVSTWYGNQQQTASAENFAVLDSTDLVLNDIVMQPGGSITGTMSPGDVAFSYVLASSDTNSYSAPVSNGSYRVSDMAAGTYSVTFHANGYTTKTVAGITVTVGGTANVDAVLDPATPPATGTTCTVTGRVTDLAGQPLPDITVQANSVSHAFMRTLADGSYSLDVNSGDDELLYLGSGYVAQTHQLNCDMTSPRDDVRLSRVVTIKGTVTTASGPLADATVWVYGANQAGGLVASTTTAADGTYTVSNLPEDYYAVSAFKDVLDQVSYPATFYPTGSSLPNATYFEAAEGSTVSHVDIALYKSGSISGHVTMSDQSSTLGAVVTVWTSGLAKTATVGADGAYSVGNLPAGTYTVSARLVSWASSHVQVTLGQGQAFTGADVDLGNGVSVSGVVSRAGGPTWSSEPVGGGIVYLRKADGQLDSVTAGADGTYVFRGVPQGTYTVATVLGDGLLYLGGATAPARAATFTVGSLPVDNVNLVLPVSRTVTVTVLLPDATPVPQGGLTVVDAYGGFVVTTPVTNGVATASLWPGTYTLTASADGYPAASTAYTAPDELTGSTTITLSRGASLTLVPDAGSAPVSAVVRDVASGVTVANGTATANGLEAGSYVVAYYPVDGNGAYCGPMAWYHGTGFVDAERVTLADGDSTSLTVHATCLPAVVPFTITGTITAPMTLDAGRVQLDLYDETGSLVRSTSNDAAGGFSFPSLVPGTYVVDTTDTSMKLLDVSASVDATSGDATVNLAMVLGGSVTGKVLDAFGHRVVTSVDLGRPGFGASEYTPTGEFAIGGLDTGDYSLRIVPAVPYAPIDMSPVHVTRGSVTDIGTVMVDPGGRITGHIPEAYGVSTVTIDAVTATGQVLRSTSAGVGNDYALWGVPQGTVYVRFSGPGFATTWWTSGDSLATATPVQVVRNGAAAGIDPTFVPVAPLPTTTISGRVSGADGPMAGVSVSASDGATTYGGGVTASDGTYTLTVPQNATYTVTASFCVGAQGELGCYGQLVETTTSAVAVATTPLTGVDVTFGAPVTVVAGQPSFSGVPTVDAAVSVDPGTWSPTDVSLSYAWSREGTPLATGATYTPTAADAGKPLTVVVTGSKAGQSASVTVTTEPVQLGTLPPATVTVPASATVGETITPTVTGWPEGTTVVLRWQSGGTEVATGPSYQVEPSDVGNVLTVTATGTKVGYTDGFAYATLGAGQPGTISGSVAVSGAVAVGQTLTAVGSWTPGSATASYTWLRDGAPVGVGATYTPTQADSGHLIGVRASVSATGYTTTTFDSATVTVPLVAGAVSLPVATVGQPVTPTLSGWPDATLTLSWNIDGRTSADPSYTPLPTDSGKTLTLTVTATKPGLASVSASATAVVEDATMAAGTVAISPAPVVGFASTAALSGWATGATYAYTWQVGGVTVSTAATYVPTGADADATLTVIVVATKQGYGTASSSASAMVAHGPITGGVVAIAGPPAVGAPLTASSSGWSVTPDAISYSWLRDGVAFGATGTTYVPTPADVGHTFSVTATATATGYLPGTATSSATAAVPPIAMTPGTPAIAGAAVVGATLTASPGTWVPADATFAYQWLRDGAVIATATGTTYVATPADAGAQLSVRVTATRAGYATTSATSAPTAVRQTSVVAGSVTVTGTPGVGSTLTAATSGWTPTSVTYAYQWLRNGTAIPGATAATYVPVPTDLGAMLSVRVTGSAAGYVSATATSAAVGPVQQRTVAAGTVTISGTPQVSFTLAANPGAWSPANVRLAYQWLRDGVAIRNATGQAYTLVAADLGHRLTVTVTGSRYGWLSASATSAPTVAVTQPQVVAGTVTITGTAAVGSRLTARPGAWTPSYVTLSYQWLRDGLAISGATGTRYVVATADVGHAITVRVTGTRAGWLSATATSATTAVVPQPRVPLTSVTILGTPVAGRLVFAVPTPIDGNVTYTVQWLRDGVAIPGARRWWYTVTTTDIGHTISVTVTGTEDGYLPATVTSAGVVAR